MRRSWAVAPTGTIERATQVLQRHAALGQDALPAGANYVAQLCDQRRCVEPGVTVPEATGQVRAPVEYRIVDLAGAAVAELIPGIEKWAQRGGYQVQEASALDRRILLYDERDGTRAEVAVNQSGEPYPVFRTSCVWPSGTPVPSSPPG